jgi:putative membrane protein
VKSFGSQMATDHSQANDNLKALAQQKGITVPDKLDASHQAAVDRLKHLSGPAFDKAFAKAMVHDHQKAVKCFQSESTTGQDNDVKDFAAKTLPTLQHHLTEAQNLQSQIK